MIDESAIPRGVFMILAVLNGAGHEAFLVGGSVRDILLGKEPHDWDITTNATPEQIISLFPHTFYENSYGTVGVVIDHTDVSHEMIVEVTPYRIESEYANNRHPNQVMWSLDLEDDLKRRDFTVNAIAYNPLTKELADPFHGKQDLEDKIIRCVDIPDKRFQEDALRLLRAVRLARQLDFDIENVSRESITKHCSLLKNISEERKRDEFTKMIMLDDPMLAIVQLNSLGLLKHIVPELISGIGCGQNQAHSYDVWEHNCRTLNHSAFKGQNLICRLAALLHDVSKPETRRYSEDRGDYTFYGHDVVGGRVSREILTRLKYPKDVIDKVSLMVRWHMFFSDTEQITLSAVRRLIVNVGKENIWDLIDLRMCDRIGTGRPKEQPFRFRVYQSMIERALTDPISLKMLKIDGETIMSVTQETPGPRVGQILYALFSMVLDDPENNTKEWLEAKAVELSKLASGVLVELGQNGKKDISDKQHEQVRSIKKQFKV